MNTLTPKNEKQLSMNAAKPNLILACMSQLRPKQWTKNILVFASALFAGTFLEYSTFLNAFLAFVCFSCVASTIYIINDIADVEKDRLHPDKCKRPLPSGALTMPTAVGLGAILFAGSTLLSYFISPQLTAVLLFYFIMNVGYSFKLKHVVLIDVMIIAAGFVLRAVAGAVAVNGNLTSWFILCAMLLSLFLALGKRRHELQLFEGDTSKQRKVMQFYSIKLLDQLISIVTGLTIMCYSLYAAENHYMMFTIPFVLYGVFRYLYLMHMENGGGKPEEILITDKHILFTVLIFACSVLFIKAYL
ncbi:decaprenyl-phosphate phosphoribosyltransferase [Paenibacillus sp. KS-LC4]|uniref:decaprenyl-phosphate phosphoribosyltransferase n=1 Tax=Paenibacillus sp. KS-LC4 TaxID=2979727 RepID=UPI0030D37DD6